MKVILLLVTVMIGCSNPALPDDYDYYSGQPLDWHIKQAETKYGPLTSFKGPNYIDGPYWYVDCIFNGRTYITFLNDSYVDEPDWEIWSVYTY